MIEYDIAIVNNHTEKENTINGRKRERERDIASVLSDIPTRTGLLRLRIPFYIVIACPRWKFATVPSIKEKIRKLILNPLYE